MDTRGLPWGVQWEVARLISRGHCTWEDISIDHLDRLRTEGLSDDSDTVLNKPIAPYIEDLFRWNKHSFGHQRTSREIQATVRYNRHCLALYTLLLTIAVIVTLARVGQGGLGL